jgi:hypothetical protein
MELRIVERQPAFAEEWDTITRSCGYATFFHSRQWAETAAMESRGSMRASATRIVFNDGASAIIPQILERKLHGIIGIRTLSFAGTYGGWISTSSLTQSHAELLAAEIILHGNVRWRENPFDPLLARVTIPGAIMDTTQVVELSDREGTGLLDRASHAHRKAVAKAKASGITVRQAESQDDWNNHFKAYSASMQRWRSRRMSSAMRYSPDFFYHLQKQPSENVKLWIAEHQQKLAASVICFYWRWHAVAFHGAAREEYFPLRPNNMLYAVMIDDAARRGYQWFDLNPSGGHRGVEEFKTHLGAQRRVCRFLDRKCGLRKVISRLAAPVRRWLP